MLDGQLTNKPNDAEIPHVAERVWSAFNDMDKARGAGFSGPLPIPYTEVASWCSLTGERLWPWELAAIRALDYRRCYGPIEEPAPDGKSELSKELKRMAERQKRKGVKNG